MLFNHGYLRKYLSMRPRPSELGLDCDTSLRQSGRRIDCNWCDQCCYRYRYSLPTDTVHMAATNCEKQEDSTDLVVLSRKFVSKPIL